MRRFLFLKCRTAVKSAAGWQGMKKRRIIIVTASAVVGALFLFSLAVFLTGGKNMPSSVIFRPASQNRLLMSMEGFQFAQFENGTVRWRMTARQADLYENKEAQARMIEVDFRGEGQRTVTLIGDRGTLNTATGDAALSRGASDVRVLTGDGYLLTTASLVWSASESLVRTFDPFKLLGTNIYLEGKGFSANTDLQQFTVKKNVKAVLQE